MTDLAYLVYDFINYDIDPEKTLERPRALNLKQDLTIRPVKKTTITFGERVQSSYYEKYENDQYVNLLLQIDHVFTRDDFGLVTQRDTKSCWTFDDGSLEEGIDTTKFYVTESERYNEIKRRRYNLIYENLIPIGRIEGLEEEITGLFETYQTQVQSYIDAGSREIITLVQNSSESWLDIVLQTGQRSSRIAIPIYLSIALPPIT